MKDIIIKKVNRIKEQSLGMDGLEIAFTVDGYERFECFDDSEYWMEKIDGEERFKKRIKENVNRVSAPEKKANIKELKKYKDVKL